MSRTPFALAALIVFALVSEAAARDRIRIVGSSTVFPFATTVAERFGHTTDFKTPIVESTGSGGGLKLFCAGIGSGHPDIANASRRIKKSEVELCAKNGVSNIIEVRIGYDGIVMANALRARDMNLSLGDIYLALAKNVPLEDGTTAPNPHQTWQDVNPALPADMIEVMGPPPTSGTRDAFVEIGMEGGCTTFAWVKALKQQDKSAYLALCHEMREDGAYIAVGENDNLIVQKLDANPNALGIFGFSFLDQNLDKVKGSRVESHEPSFENIASGDYPLSRPLYFYVKKAHVGTIPGLEAYMDEFTRERTVGPDGYLVDKGLIPLPDDERHEWRERTRALTNLVI